MTKRRQCKLMCIVAHPDDEGQCAGAIMRETRQDEWAVVVWMTNGAKGWSLPEKADHEKVIAVRREEAKAALQILGAEGYWLDYEDSELAYNADVVLRVASVIRQYRPKIVITHAQDTWHPDHQATSRIVTEAVRLSGSRLTMPEQPPHHVKSLYYFVGNRQTQPDFFLDVSDLMDDKLAARTIHESQFPKVAEERYRAMATIWGAEAGVKYAEAYLEPRKRTVLRLP